MSGELEEARANVAVFQKQCEEFLVIIVQQKRDADEQQKVPRTQERTHCRFFELISKPLLKTDFISERELAFTFAIMLSPVCLSSVVCLSVCNVRAPYSGGSNFRQYFYGIRYLGHPLTSTENFTEIVPGEPLRRGS